MTTRKDGGPAFPRNALSGGDHGYPVQSDGMSLRDWFAGQALAGLIASGRSAYDLLDGDYQAAYAAYRAYTVADAMLAAREKEGR